MAVRPSGTASIGDEPPPARLPAPVARRIRYGTRATRGRSTVTELLYFPLDAETSIAVEVDAQGRGFEHAGTPDVRKWPEQLSAAIAPGRRAVEQVLSQ